MLVLVLVCLAPFFCSGCTELFCSGVYVIGLQLYGLPDGVCAQMVCVPTNVVHDALC